MFHRAAVALHGFAALDADPDEPVDDPEDQHCYPDRVGRRAFRACGSGSGVRGVSGVGYAPLFVEAPGVLPDLGFGGVASVGKGMMTVMGSGYGGMMGGYAMMWPWMILVTAVVVAGLIVLILVVVMLARAGHTQTLGPDDWAARRILDERYARGEIDHEEYRRRRDALA